MRICTDKNDRDKSGATVGGGKSDSDKIEYKRDAGNKSEEERVVVEIRDVEGIL